MRRYGWLFVVVIAAAISGSGNAATTVPLQLSSMGGFAYVFTPAQHKLEIGFMPAYAVTDCSMPAQKVDLIVNTGTIVEPANNPRGNRKFDVAGAVIMIEDSTPDANKSLTVTKTPGRIGPPYHPHPPANPELEGSWKDATWVGGLTEKGPANPIASDWRSKVNGHLELTNGTVTAGRPSNRVARWGTWDFKHAPNDSATFTQAVTDRIIYQVNLPGSDVVIDLNRSGTVTRLRIKPFGGHVRLSLNGEHPNAPKSIPKGSRIEHFCSYYQLMNPIPPSSTWLYPHFNGTLRDAPTSGRGGVAGDPGFYCPGDWF